MAWNIIHIGLLTAVEGNAGTYYYAALLPRRGPHIASHSVCPSVRLSVRPVIVAIGNVLSSTASVTDVLFGTHWGPHIVRPSRPHRFLFPTVYIILPRQKSTAETFISYDIMMRNVWNITAETVICPPKAMCCEEGAVNYTTDRNEQFIFILLYHHQKRNFR